MLARKARSMGRSQEAQELSSSGRPGTEPQDFGPRSLVPVRSSSASSPVQTNQNTAIFSSWSDSHTRGLCSVHCSVQKHCIYLYCTQKPTLYLSIFQFFTKFVFYLCSIPATSLWHHSSVQHPQSSLLSPHRHFLSESPHPQDAEIFHHISTARYFNFGGLACGYYDYVGSSPSNPSTFECLAVLLH